MGDYTTKSNYLWRINNFNSYYFGQAIESPTFSKSPDDLKWNLSIFSEPYGSLALNYLCFKFHSKDLRYFTTHVSLSICILTNDTKKPPFKKTRYFKLEKRADPAVSCSEYYFTDFIQISDILCTSNYLYHGELRVLCEYELIPTQDIENRIFILDLFEKRRQDKKFSDFELVAPCGRKLFAHKFVLSANSPVLCAMFENDMREKRLGLVKIKDLSYETLQEVLYYMYCGKFDKLNHELVDSVLIAADKYQISHLKNACIEFLHKNLGIDNCLKTLKLCKVFDLTDLKSHVDTFLRENAKLIYEKEVMQKEDNSNIYIKCIYDKAEEVELNNLPFRRKNIPLKLFHSVLCVMSETFLNSETNITFILLFSKYMAKNLFVKLFL